MVNLGNGYVVGADRYNFSLYKQTGTKGALIAVGHYQSLHALLEAFVTKTLREVVSDDKTQMSIESLCSKLTDLYSYVDTAAESLKNVTPAQFNKSIKPETEKKVDKDGVQQSETA